MALPSTIKQWETAQDGIDKLHFTAASLPEPSDGEVLVKIKAVSLNYRDTEVINGEYGHHKSLAQGKRLVPCSDMCGVIVRSKSQQWREGERVLSTFNQTHLTGQIKEEDMASGLGFPLPGVLTEYRVFPATGLVRVPPYLTDIEASTLPIAGVTAWMALNGQRAPGSAGKPTGNEDGHKPVVLLQGTGGVAIAGLQQANSLEFDTIVLSSSDKKLSRTSGLGATHTINYSTKPEWQDEVLKLTEGRGVDIAFELGGARTLRKTFGSIAFGGLINCIGYLSGKDESQSKGSLRNSTTVAASTTMLAALVAALGYLSTTENRRGHDLTRRLAIAGALCTCLGGLSTNIWRLLHSGAGKVEKEPASLHTNVLALSRNVTLKGIINGPKDRFEEMLAWYTSKEIRPVVDRVFGFEKADEALRTIASGGHYGKIVVRVAETE